MGRWQDLIEEGGSDLVDVSPYLAETLGDLTDPTLVLVHGESLADAEAAVAASDMMTSIVVERIGVVGAVGTKSQIQDVPAERASPTSRATSRSTSSRRAPTPTPCPWAATARA